jgi:hypothetical protein
MKCALSAKLTLRRLAAAKMIARMRGLDEESAVGLLPAFIQVDLQLLLV